MASRRGTRARNRASGHRASGKSPRGQTRKASTASGRRKAPTRTASARKSATGISRPKRAGAARSASANVRRTPAKRAGIGRVWKPAIAMATLPFRLYRVYRWAEAEERRSSTTSVAP